MGLQPREQKLLIALAALVLGTFLWLGIIRPVETTKATNLMLYQSAKTELEWMQVHAGHTAGNGTAVSPIPAGSTLLMVIADQAKLHQIVISHVTPAEDGSMQLSLEECAFKNLLAWLESVQRSYGIEASTLRIARVANSPGYVNVNMTLYIK